MTRLHGYTRAQMPLELARTQLALAEVMVDDQPDVAVVEARAALTTFERLDASRLADQAAALLRRLGVRVPTGRPSEGLLTRRESEVLALIGAGMSNPEIADRLFISRKTVEHHVSNVLAKLGLRGRSEAAAYAARAAAPTKPGDE